jgi:hypothetical protein
MILTVGVRHPVERFEGTLVVGREAAARQPDPVESLERARLELIEWMI